MYITFTVVATVATTFVASVVVTVDATVINNKREIFHE